VRAGPTGPEIKPNVKPKAHPAARILAAARNPTTLNMTFPLDNSSKQPPLIYQDN
jgi:hypothetical protein